MVALRLETCVWITKILYGTCVNKQTNILSGSREHALSHLIKANEVDVAVVTETDMPSTEASGFALEGFVTFSPLGSEFLMGKDRVRVLIFVRASIADTVKLRPDLMSTTIQSIWVELAVRQLGVIVIGGLYRQFRQPPSLEVEELEESLSQARCASLGKCVIMLGDFNLDSHKTDDPSYYKRALLKSLEAGMTSIGLTYNKTPATWRSNGCHGGLYLSSCLDHIYHLGVRAEVTVLPDTSTDHRPVMAMVSGLGSSEPPVTIVRRNYKAVSRSDLEEASSRSDWSALYAIRDVEDVLAFITANIIEALDLICPPKRITVKKGHNLYLANDTLRLMAA
jgi:hypothetical protein